MSATYSDLITKIREQQNDLSSELSDQLFQELKPYIHNRNIAALEGYVDSVYVRTPLQDDIDPKAMEIGLKSEIRLGVFKSIMGYTDWVAARIVRSGDYSVPSPREIPFEAIEGKYYTPSQTLRRAVSFMHSKESLPLLGRIEQGMFCPDKDEFEQWKGFFDWSKK